MDVSVPKKPVGDDPEYVSELASWLVRNQPISLAINGSDAVAMQLFEETGQVVYSVGDVHGATALTCQARPQDGEVFGEFPPRKELFKYTKFPMVIPSPPAAYNSHYNHAHLRSLVGASASALPAMFQDVESTERKGYLIAVSSVFVYLCIWCWSDGGESKHVALRTRTDLVYLSCHSCHFFWHFAFCILMLSFLASSLPYSVLCSPVNALFE